MLVGQEEVTKSDFLLHQTSSSAIIETVEQPQTPLASEDKEKLLRCITHPHTRWWQHNDDLVQSLASLG